MGKRRAVAAEAAKKCLLQEVCLYDNADVLNRRENDWVDGWLTTYKRVWVHTFINAVEFNNTLSTYTSREYFVEPYSKAALLIDLDVTLAPTDIVIQVEMSDDGVNWYRYVEGPFGDLRYEDSAGDIKHALNFNINTTYIRLRAVATGVSAVNKFALTAKLSLSS